jgi:hypothetical protein
MKRAYDVEARKALAKFFENCAAAVLDEKISDPGDLGDVAGALRLFVAWSEGLHQDENSAVEWFEASTLHAVLVPPIARRLWRGTGVCVDDLAPHADPVLRYRLEVERAQSQKVEHIA